MKNNNNRRRKVKGQNQNHNRKILYKKLDSALRKQKSTLHLSSTPRPLKSTKCVSWFMKVTSTDKILTRYWQTSYNHLEWKTREQQTNRENEISPPPLLHSPRPPPPGERSGPIRGEITNSADSWSNPTLNLPSSLKEEIFKANAKIFSP